MFRRLINWIINLKCRIKFKELETLKFGDEFWANITEYEGQPFAEGHQIRPFMFIELNDDKISCLYESTKGGRYSIPITGGKHTTYIYYKQLYKIDVKKYLHKKNSSIKKSELIELVRNGFTRYPLNIFYSKFKEYAEVKVGDIVRYNNSNYYLFALDSVRATIYPITECFSEFYVRTSNRKYIAIFSPLQVKKENISLICPENPKLVSVIKEQKNLARKHRRKCKKRTSKV